MVRIIFAELNWVCRLPKPLCHHASPFKQLSQEPVYAVSAVLLQALKRNVYKEKEGGISLWAFLWVSVTTGGVWATGDDLEKSVSSLATMENWTETRLAIAALLGKYSLGARHLGCSN